MSKRKTYYFKKYYPGFCTGFESDFDYVEFINWKSFIKRYTKEFPLRDGFVYCYSEDYLMVARGGENPECWVVGRTDFPLSKHYNNYKLVKGC